MEKREEHELIALGVIGNHRFGCCLGFCCVDIVLFSVSNCVMCWSYECLLFVFSFVGCCLCYTFFFEFLFTANDFAYTLYVYKQQQLWNDNHYFRSSPINIECRHTINTFTHTLLFGHIFRIFNKMLLICHIWV